MKPIKTLLILLLLILCNYFTIARAADRTSDCDVIWTTPSKDAVGSMPLGNGEVGINLWVEENGDLNFYISRSDSFSEISRLLKVGQIKVAITPNPFVTGAPFKQRLNLQDGVCEITAGGADKRVSLKVFVDSDRPIIHVTGTAASPVTVKASIIRWRTEDRKLPKAEQRSAWSMHDAPFDLIESGDQFIPRSQTSVAWFHWNHTSVVPSTIEVQSLQSATGAIHDPLLNRIFGGLLTGQNFVSVDDASIETVAPTTSLSLQVTAPVQRTVELVNGQYQGDTFRRRLKVQAVLKNGRSMRSILRLPVPIRSWPWSIRPAGGMIFGTARTSSPINRQSRAGITFSDMCRPAKAGEIFRSNLMVEFSPLNPRG